MQDLLLNDVHFHPQLFGFLNVMSPLPPFISLPLIWPHTFVSPHPTAVIEASGLLPLPPVPGSTYPAITQSFPCSAAPRQAQQNPPGGWFGSTTDPAWRSRSIYGFNSLENDVG